MGHKIKRQRILRYQVIADAQVPANSLDDLGDILEVEGTLESLGTNVLKKVLVEFQEATGSKPNSLLLYRITLDLEVNAEEPDELREIDEIMDEVNGKFSGELTFLGEKE